MIASAGMEDLPGCPGCLKPGHKTYCRNCRLRLFDGKGIAHILPFTRPEYEKVQRQTGGRISLSGVQTKHSLKLVDNKLELTEREGQYLLKPIPNAPFLDEVEQIPANEQFTMFLARQVYKINTAEPALIFFKDGTPAYLVRRFDVQPDGQRLLQEDFAQIAGRSQQLNGPNYKYDFSYEGIGRLMKMYVPAYKVEVEKFFRLVLFNYLIANGDAHLKNFSLYRDLQHGYVLTPAYDLLCTRLHTPAESDTGLDLFEEGFQTESYAANGFYAYDDFYALGIRLGILESRVVRFIQEFTLVPPALEKLLNQSFLSPEARQNYLRMVEDRTGRFRYSFRKSRP